MGGDSSVEVADGEIPEETAGPYPGRRLQRAQRADRERRRPLRHHQQLRLGDRAWPTGVPLTLRFKVYDLTGDDVDDPRRRRASTPGTATATGNYSMYDGDAVRRELPARRAGDRRGRLAGVHHDLPRLLRRSLAARALRGLRVARQGDQRVQQAAHLPARVPAGRLRGGLRDLGLRVLGRQPGRRQPGLRRDLLRRLLAAAGEDDRVRRGGLRRHPQSCRSDPGHRPGAGW